MHLWQRDCPGVTIPVPNPVHGFVGRLREPLEAHGIEIGSQGQTQLHEHLPFEVVTKMMSSTKMIINSNFTIQGGSYERIWHGMARGCAVITNESSYLRDEFGEDEGIIFIPEKQELLGSFLRQVLGDPDRLSKITAMASQHYSSRHSWRHRAQDLLELLKIKY